MCGIFGYVGQQNAISICLNGLKKLEYRGYDSSGVAWVEGNRISVHKDAVKIAALEASLRDCPANPALAIGHTRWATHGRPSKENAHPHTDEKHSLAVVHNGIIENYERLRQKLLDEGVRFVSETDTEVVAHLIAQAYEGDLLAAVQKVVPALKGAFALAVVHQDHPHEMVALAQASPLVIGIGTNETFIASDTHAFLAHTREVIYLTNGEVALIRGHSVDVYDQQASQVIKARDTLAAEVQEASKGTYDHFMLKEIFEQPQSIANALLSRYIEPYGTASLEEMTLDPEDLHAVKKVLILACGTSWHAGLMAAQWLEEKARLPTQVEVASEFRYKNLVLEEGTLGIAISQSGETADTIAAVRELKAKQVKVLAICNVQGSTLAREADASLFLRAGPEISVCSTKAFTSQLIVLSLFTLFMGRMRQMSKTDGQTFLKALKKLPEQVQQVLDQHEKIRKVAKKYAAYDNFFFLGRRYMYPTALEGALKLKEISYINANGYPAGEMKHGPIALISEQCPIIALCADSVTYEKMCSNIMEAKARGGPIIAITTEKTAELEQVADEILEVPETLDEFACIPASVVMQLLAYEIAAVRKTNIDQPRNLAKSVTVE